MVVAPEEPKQPEIPSPLTMSVPVSVDPQNLNVHDIQTQHVKSKGCDMDGSIREPCPEIHYDEYTTLLKKHLNVVESELSRLKGPQT